MRKKKERERERLREGLRERVGRGRAKRERSCLTNEWEEIIVSRFLSEGRVLKANTRPAALDQF